MYLSSSGSTASHSTTTLTFVHVACSQGGDARLAQARQHSRKQQLHLVFAVLRLQFTAPLQNDLHELRHVANATHATRHVSSETSPCEDPLVHLVSLGVLRGSRDETVVEEAQHREIHQSVEEEGRQLGRQAGVCALREERQQQHAEQ